MNIGRPKNQGYVWFTKCVKAAGLLGESGEAMIAELFPTTLKNALAHALHQREVKVQIVNGVQAVSYTHLTLPTIYSV